MHMRMYRHDDQSVCDCLQSVLCADDNTSSSDVLFYAWKLFSETAVLLLVMLFSGQWVSSNVYCR